MFTKDEVNSLVLQYNKDFKRNIPMFESVKYDEENANACVRLDEFSQGSYVLHISDKMESFNHKYQESVLYHELTHVFDFFNYKDKCDNISNILKSYSEAHAEVCKIRFLIGIFDKPKILNLSKIKVNFEHESQTLAIVSENYFNQSKYWMEHFLNSYNPMCINIAIGQIMYFCGYLTLEINGKTIFKKMMNLYPEKYRRCIINIGMAVFNNNPITSAEEYGKLLRICRNDSINYALKISNKNT